MNCDPIAKVYRPLETIAFGHALQRARVRWLSEVGSPQRVLICGEGNGRFIAELVRLYPKAQIDCVDLSARMLELAKERVESVQVNYIQADIREWSPPRQYDLVVTHFFLDFFEGAELETVVRKFALAAGSNATWLLADFRILDRGFAHWWSRLFLATMYLFFRITCGVKTRELIDPTELIAQHGFVCAERTLSFAGFIKSALWRRPL